MIYRIQINLHSRNLERKRKCTLFYNSLELISTPFLWNKRDIKLLVYAEKHWQVITWNQCKGSNIKLPFSSDPCITGRYKEDRQRPLPLQTSKIPLKPLLFCFVFWYFWCNSSIWPLRTLRNFTVVAQNFWKIQLDRLVFWVILVQYQHLAFLNCKKFYLEPYTRFKGILFQPQIPNSKLMQESNLFKNLFLRIPRLICLFGIFETSGKFLEDKLLRRYEENKCRS